VPWNIAASIILTLLIFQFTFRYQPTAPDRLHRLRTHLIVAAMVLALSSFLILGPSIAGISTVLFVMVLVEEILGRWSFYQARTSGASAVRRKEAYAEGHKVPGLEISP
jgi:hypothetical protein